jgi:hypothetical protein
MGGAGRVQTVDDGLRFTATLAAMTRPVDRDFLEAVGRSVRERLLRSDQVSLHSTLVTPALELIVIYERTTGESLYAQRFDTAFFDGFDDDPAACASTIVANELEPPHGLGTARTPAHVDPSLLPPEAVRWID